MMWDELDLTADARSQGVTCLLLIDNHPLFRATVEQYLQHSCDGKVHVVGLSATGDVLAVATAVRPRIILVDIAHPSGSGLDMIRRLRTLLPYAAIVAMGWEDNTVVQQEAHTAGADVFLLKGCLNTTLLPTVNALTRAAWPKQAS